MLSMWTLAITLRSDMVMGNIQRVLSMWPLARISTADIVIMRHRHWLAFHGLCTSRPYELSELTKKKYHTLSM